jgi:hypothetical protein
MLTSLCQRLSNANTEESCWTLYQEPSTSFLHKNVMCAYVSSTKATCLVHHNFLTFSYLAKPGDQNEPCSPCYATFCSLVFLRHLILWTNKYRHSPSGGPTKTVYSYLSSRTHTNRSTSPPPGFILPT